VTGIHDIALFIAAGLLLNLTPGPDMAYIAGRSAAGGFREGAAAVFGINAGCVVHTLAAAIGLSALLATSATAFEVVKWGGALYLLYAGVRLLASAGGQADPAARTTARSSRSAAPDPAGRSSPLGAAPAARATPLRIFREALLINVLNPKVALFFLAFVPQFIAGDAPDKPLAFVLLGMLFTFNSLFVNLPVAWLASRAGRRLRAGARGLQWARRVAGGLFIVLAARLAAFSRD
jgi:threonine/homoserine/homoserine lactone efflux protein